MELPSVGKKRKKILKEGVRRRAAAAGAGDGRLGQDKHWYEPEPGKHSSVMREDRPGNMHGGNEAKITRLMEIIQRNGEGDWPTEAGDRVTWK